MVPRDTEGDRLLKEEAELMLVRQTSHESVYRLKNEHPLSCEIAAWEEQIARIEQEINWWLVKNWSRWSRISVNGWFTSPGLICNGPDPGGRTLARSPPALVQKSIPGERRFPSCLGAKAERTRTIHDPCGLFHPARGDGDHRPNMGGKTVGLKTFGLIAVLAQYGFFVPAAACDMPLFSWVAGLIGDGQGIRQGLSRFGAEMVRFVSFTASGNGTVVVG